MMLTLPLAQHLLSLSVKQVLVLIIMWHGSARGGLASERHCDWHLKKTQWEATVLVWILAHCYLNVTALRDIILLKLKEKNTKLNLRFFKCLNNNLWYVQCHPCMRSNPFVPRHKLFRTFRVDNTGPLSLRGEGGWHTKGRRRESHMITFHRTRVDVIQLTSKCSCVHLSPKLDQRGGGVCAESARFGKWRVQCM